VTVIYGHDMISNMETLCCGHDVVLCEVGENLSRYFNEIESVSDIKLTRLKRFTFPCHTPWRPEQLV